MRFAIISIAAFAISTGSIAGNFAECILEKMPSVANAAANAAVHRACTQAHPEKYMAIERGTGRGIFGYKDENACTIKKGKDTPFPYAAGAIAVACNCLYRKPDFEGERCDYPQVPSLQ